MTHTGHATSAATNFGSPVRSLPWSCLRLLGRLGATSLGLFLTTSHIPAPSFAARPCTGFALHPQHWGKILATHRCKPHHAATIPQFTQQQLTSVLPITARLGTHPTMHGDASSYIPPPTAAAFTSCTNSFAHYQLISWIPVQTQLCPLQQCRQCIHPTRRLSECHRQLDASRYVLHACKQIIQSGAPHMCILSVLS